MSANEYVGMEARRMIGDHDVRACYFDRRDGYLSPKQNGSSRPQPI